MIYILTLFVTLSFFFSQEKIDKDLLLKQAEELQLENETWDWTDPNAYPEYFYINSQPPITCTFPFYDATLGIVTENSDFKKSDGWTLLYRDFGTAATANSPIRTVKMPYMVLYNRNSGLMRVFVYIVAQEQYFKVSIQTYFEINGSANLNFTSKRAHGLDKKSKYELKSTVGQADGTNGHWMYSDIPISYDPNINLQEHVAFIFDVKGIEVNDITLDGTILLEQKDQAIVSHTGKANDNFDSFQKSVGEKFDSWSKWNGRGEDYYKKAAERTNDAGLKASLLQTAATIKAAPFGALGAIYGIADFFLGGGTNVAPPMPLIFEGSIHLSGTMTTEEFIGRLKMRVPGSIPPEFDFWPPVTEKPLGIFNLQTNPVLERVSYQQSLGDYPAYWHSYKLNSNINTIINTVDVDLLEAKAALVFTIEGFNNPLPDEAKNLEILNKWVSKGFIFRENVKVGHYKSQDGTVDEERMYYTFRTAYLPLSTLKDDYINIPLIRNDERTATIENVAVKIWTKFRSKANPSNDPTILVTTYEPTIIDKNSTHMGPWGLKLKASTTQDKVILEWPLLFSDVDPRTTYKMQKSSDGVNWTEHWSVLYPSMPFVKYSYTPTSTGQYRWYRMQMTDNHGLNIYSDVRKVTNPNYVYVPFSASISGSSVIPFGQSRDYTALPVNGSGSYSYKWYWKRLGGGGGEDPEPFAAASSNKKDGDVVVNAVPSNQWVLMNTTSSVVTFDGTMAGSYTVKCLVKDLTRNITKTVYKSFTVGSSSQALATQSNFSAKSSFASTPKEFALKQNFPNPFNPVTTITYELTRSTNVKVSIFNTLGQRVKLFNEGVKTAGSYDLTWDASHLASGVYIYRIEAEGKVEHKKMILMK